MIHAEYFYAFSFLHFKAKQNKTNQKKGHVYKAQSQSTKAVNFKHHPSFFFSLTPNFLFSLSL